MITSKDAKKIFNKTQYTFMIKSLNKLGIEGMSLSIMKSIHDKSLASLVLIKENLKAFPVSQDQVWHQCSPLLYNIVLEFIARAVWKRKK
jgi:hypothetical protein